LHIKKAAFSLFTGRAPTWVGGCGWVESARFRRVCACMYVLVGCASVWQSPSSMSAAIVRYHPSPCARACPRLRRDSAHPSHSAPGPGAPLPHLRQDSPIARALTDSHSADEFYDGGDGE
jgi:hypothetical protein